MTAVGGSRTESYSYDLNGNRNSTGYTTGTANELTASTGYTYTYDAEGNLLSQTNTSSHVTTTYAYDYRNRLTNVTAGGTVVATYTYDALDRRIGIKDNGTQTWTVYDGTSPAALPYADFNSSGSLTERYLSGVGLVNGAIVDELLARTSSGGTTAWYLPDKLGSVRDIVDPSGNELDHVVYDSFGNIVTETNAGNGDRFKFAEMEYDSTTGQYYDRARYYGSTAGRFESQDPKGFGARDTNLYRYVGDGPTNGVDPSGKDDYSSEYEAGEMAAAEAQAAMAQREKAQKMAQERQQAKGQLIGQKYQVSLVQRQTWREMLKTQMESKAELEGELKVYQKVAKAGKKLEEDEKERMAILTATLPGVYEAIDLLIKALVDAEVGDFPNPPGPFGPSYS
jgi:RHS repeat-associated protein